MNPSFSDSTLYSEAQLTFQFVHQDLLQGRSTAPTDIRPAVLDAGLSLVAAVPRYQALLLRDPAAAPDEKAAALRDAQSACVTLESHLRCYRILINTKEPSSMGLASVERLGQVLGEPVDQKD